MYERVKKAIKELNKAMLVEGVDPTRGLPEELFLLSSTLVPIVNVDLFVTNATHQLLFVWRDEKYNGSGWHIPRSCVRLKESLEERLMKAANKELGVPIDYDPNPLAVRAMITSKERPLLDNQLKRCHSISFLYTCRIKDGYTIPSIYDGVELRWFDRTPENLLETHLQQYGDIIENYFNGGTMK